MSRNRGFRLFILLLAIGGLGYFLYLKFNRGNSEIGQFAEDAYQEGSQAYSEKQYSLALEKFDVAFINSSKVIQRIQDDIAKGKLSKEKVEEWKSLQGKLLWVRVRCLLDGPFAKSHLEGKPLPELEDSITGEKFRNYWFIPEQKNREMAINNLRELAIQVMPNNPEVVREALRMEVQRPVLDWNTVKLLSDQSLIHNPNDTRSLFMLARYQFDQPQVSGPEAGLPTPILKRSKTRINRSLDWIGQLKKLPKFPYWRTLHLEIQNHLWLLQDADANQQPAEADKESALLTQLLLDEKNGAVSQLIRGENLDRLSTWDGEGILAIFLAAVHQKAAEFRKTELGTDQLADLTKKTIQFCQNMIEKDNPAFPKEQILSTVLSSLQLSQVAVLSQQPEKWEELTKITKPILETLGKKGVGPPQVYGHFGEILLREYLWKKKGTLQPNLEKEALHWLDQGFQLAEKLKPGAEEKSPFALRRYSHSMEELHASGLEMKYGLNLKSSELAPHLAGLEKSTNPNFKAVHHLLKAATLQKEGKLEKSRDYLEECEKLKTRETQLRAQILLVYTNLSMGEPERALYHLRDVEKAYERFNQLSLPEKIWATEFLRTSEELHSLLILANLETAQVKIKRFQKLHPGKPLAREVYVAHENTALFYLKKLPNNSVQEQSSRQNLVTYYLAIQNLDRAREELIQLKKDFPNKSEVLQLENVVELTEAFQKAGNKNFQKIEADLRPKFDERIQQFVKTNPKDTSSKLYWALWLTRTNRVDQALAFLKDPSQFPQDKDLSYQRVLSLAILTKGDQVEGLKLLEHMPQNPQMDSVLIRLLGSIDEKQKQVEQALSRHENAGIFQCWNGALAFSQEKYLEAAQAYQLALDFTKVKPLAEMGLQRSLVGVAYSNPQAVIDIAKQVLKNYPDESAVLLPYAFAALKLGKVGDPNDVWERSPTMAGALNRWESFYQEKERQITSLTKAEFWIRANRPEYARGELQRALRFSPNNHLALQLDIRLAINAYEPQHSAEIHKSLDLFKKIRPKDLLPKILEAQLLEREGEPAKAKEIYQEILREFPEDSNSYYKLVALNEKQNPQQAKVWLERWRSKLPEDGAGQLLEIGMLAKEQKSAEANGLAEKILQAHLDRNRKLLPQEKLENTKDYQIRLGKLLKEVEGAFALQAAKVFHVAKVWDFEEKWIQRVLQKDPNNVPANLILGESYLARKQWDQTRDHYQKMFDLNPKNDFVANILAWVLADPLKDNPKAFQILQEFHKAQFSNAPLPAERLSPDFLDTIGLVYSQMNQKELFLEMRELFDSAKRRYPQDARIHLYLGISLAELKEKGKAIESLNTAKALANQPINRTLDPAQRMSVIRKADEVLRKLTEIE